MSLPLRTVKLRDLFAPRRRFSVRTLNGTPIGAGPYTEESAAVSAALFLAAARAESVEVLDLNGRAVKRIDYIIS